MNDEIKKADEIVTGLKFFADKCDRTNIGCHAPNLLKGAADLIESLTAQLTESQRREKAAVEAVGKFARNAHTCISGDSPECHVKDDHGWCAKCPAWQWRGPQEAER